MRKVVRVIIAGGRDFVDYNLLKEICDYKLSTFSDDETWEIMIVSGGAKGADFLGEVYAYEKRYALKRFPANWQKHGRAAGVIRNEEMAIFADLLIAFWDGQSSGTRDMIDRMKHKNKKHFIQRYTPPPTAS